MRSLQSPPPAARWGGGWWGSVTQDVYEGHGEDTLPLWVTLDVANPPLLVLLSRDDDDLSLDEGQLVVVVRLAVVDGLDPTTFALPRVDLPGQRNGCLGTSCWAPIGLLDGLLGGGADCFRLLIGCQRVGVMGLEVGLGGRLR